MKNVPPIFRSFVFCIVSLSILLRCPTSNAQVRLPKLVSDGMILQRDNKINIWGWAKPGEKVSVKFISHTYKAIAGEDGRWALFLPPANAGGPYEMEIDGSSHILIKNILIGDVWFCSGQSNMQINMGDIAEKYPKEIAMSDNNMIRQFLVPDFADPLIAHTDLNYGEWLAAKPATIKQFSAAAYFFALSIFNKYHVPVGIINSSYGGTPIEAWISPTALKSFPSLFKDYSSLTDTGNLNHLVETAKENQAMEYARTDNKYDIGLNGTKMWYDTSYHTQNLPSLLVPGYWADQGFRQLNGALWFRKTVNLPATVAGKAGLLQLGRIVDADDTYVNGVLVGRSYHQFVRRNYQIPPGLLHGGENTLVVRVKNYSGKGGFVPDKPYYLTVGTDTIDLTGKWQYQIGQVYPLQKTVPGSTPFFLQNQPAVLFNGMVAPVTPYTIKGFAWFQGESNVGGKTDYALLLSVLINDWRNQWHQGNLPFLFVQLENFLETDYLPAESQWAEFRESQMKALSVPNTGMAVAIDAGEWNDVHALDKEDIGYRLALQAERLAYGDKTIVASGPYYRSAKVLDNEIIVSFDNVGRGLESHNGGPLKQFSIAGADKRFVWANAIIQNNQVIVSSPEVSQPMYVRYAWSDNPQGANLYNKEGLPAAPFRSDNH